MKVDKSYLGFALAGALTLAVVRNLDAQMLVCLVIIFCTLLPFNK